MGGDEVNAGVLLVVIRVGEPEERFRGGCSVSD